MHGQPTWYGQPIAGRNAVLRAISGDLRQSLADNGALARVKLVDGAQFDPTPFWRSTVGFERLFEMLDQSARHTGEERYPPYNLERTGENHYRISLALAGFTREQVTITAEQNVLTVEGAKPDKAQHEFLYQGIATRPFRRVFNLADHVQVKGAAFENGLLMIELVRQIAEAMKPRRIAVNGNAPTPITQKKVG